MRTEAVGTAAPGGITVEHVFTWRTALGPWRWWFLGSLGVASSACDGTAANPTRPRSEPSACVLESSLAGGWERCTNGMLHRTEAGVCPSVLPRPGYAALYTPPAADAGVDAGLQPSRAAYAPECVRDSDCTAKPYGHCEPYSLYHCEYGCARDADCAAGEVCVCGELAGSCAPAACRTDADCASGALCGNFPSIETCYLAGSFACQSPDDECAGYADCSEGLQCSSRPAFQGDPADPRGPHVCAQLACPVIGRPFLIAGAERLAPFVDRRDWCATPFAKPTTPVGDPVLRAAVARGWLEQAQMEHASVAAFARFALQLLGLGAPADLVHGAARAMQDEIRHARACFELARHHSDSAVGPAALDVEDALADSDLRSVVLGTLREGCIGETIAALEAREALEHCEDAATRGVLQQIATDEAQHAELAWRFVAWAFELGSSSLRESVRAAFADALAEPVADRVRVSAFDRALARHGLFADPLRRALRARVLAEVIGPCADALLAGRIAVAPPRGARADGSAYLAISTA